MLLGSVLFSDSKGVCLNKMLTGIHCPLCGMTRAVHELISLRIPDAIHYKATVLVLPFILCLVIAHDLFNKNFIRRAAEYFIILFIVSLGILYLIRFVLHGSAENLQLQYSIIHWFCLRWKPDS